MYSVSNYYITSRLSSSYNVFPVQMNQVGADMEQIYNTATVCGRPGYDPSICYPLDPGDVVTVCLLNFTIFVIGIYMN